MYILFLNYCYYSFVHSVVFLFDLPRDLHLSYNINIVRCLYIPFNFCSPVVVRSNITLFFMPDYFNIVPFLPLLLSLSVMYYL